MNNASQNRPHHLGILRERMLHPTDHERAVHYFLEEFAGDAVFLRQSAPEDAPHFLAVLARVTAGALGQPVVFDQARTFHLAEPGFFHGSAAVAGRVVLFFYFEQTNTGIMTLIPGGAGGMEVARFRLTSGLVNPKNN